ncbi:ABC transporter ATP-binding protein [Flexivirga meconopsidis]|uniref:ABC transporter ATP-binding protein n=1 Tax=Flexivirga meconopsidis TaxID=2977121 RepID=UPI00223F9FCB|nr:ABC transporter ATP-binding protein [Flexivirga meconopsidis]
MTQQLHSLTPPPTADRTLLGDRLVKRYAPSVQDSPPALAGVSLAVAPGESVAVMGPSGSGKTTLLHVLAGIVRPDEGDVVWNGNSLRGASDATRTTLRRSEFGFVFQSGQLIPELPAIENVALPLLLGGTDRRQAEARAAALFAPLGLGGLERRRPGELSGGQAQRVAIARALVGTPGVVFADEPTGALDQHTSGEVMHHLTGLSRHLGASLLIVTHDANVAGWCDRTLHMQDGRIVGEARR